MILLTTSGFYKFKQIHLLLHLQPSFSGVLSSLHLDAKLLLLSFQNHKALHDLLIQTADFQSEIKQIVSQQYSTNVCNLAKVYNRETYFYTCIWYTFGTCPIGNYLWKGDQVWFSRSTSTPLLPLLVTCSNKYTMYVCMMYVCMVTNIFIGQ